MEEKEIIKKLQKLGTIKPRKEWVVLTKEKILASEKISFKERFSQIGRILFTPVKKPALLFAFRGILLAVLVLAGIFFYLYQGNSPLEPQKNLSLLKPQPNKLIASLKELQESLKEIRVSLDNLKNFKNQREALVMTTVIKGTASRAEEIVKKIKHQSSGQVLASLQEVESSFQELAQTSQDLQKEMVRQAFEDLKTRTLSPENAQRLIKAQEYFQQGKEDEALILIIRIYEKTKF